MNAKIKWAIRIGLFSIVNFAIAGSFKSPSLWKGVSIESKEKIFFFATINGCILLVLAIAVVVWFFLAKKPTIPTVWHTTEKTDEEQNDWEHHPSYPN